MGYIQATGEFDRAVMEAGNRFVSQVQPVLHPLSLAVVLLNSEGNPGQAVFTWGPPHQSGISQSATLAHVPSPTDIPEHSLRISLHGQGGSLGAVLLRGDFPHGCDPEQAELLQATTQQLALTLENLQLKERMHRKSVEDQGLENIASLVAANLPPGPTYRRFSGEVKNLIHYERITVYLSDEKGGAPRQVCQLGLGDCHGDAGVSGNLSGAAWESIVSSGTGLIIQDNAQPGPWIWPGIDDNSGLRSALVAPVRYPGEVMGAVALESRWPNAYGPADLGLLSKAGALLRPWIANLRQDNRLQAKAKELAVTDGMGKAIASFEGMETVFDYMAKAANELIPFDHATLTWINPAASEISALHWPGGANSPGYFNNIGCRRLQTALVFGKEEIGALTLTREGGVEFTEQDSLVLERLASQISPVIQNARFKSQRAPAEVGQANKLQVSTTASAVHELRTPLTAIKGYSSALLQSDVSWPPEMYREFLETIDQETDRLNEVISRLTPTVDNQSDLPGLNLQKTSIEVLFDQAQADLGLVDWTKAVAFRCEPDLPMAMVDSARLVQILGHLICCAAEFTQPGEPIQVRGCRRQGGPAIVIGTDDTARPRMDRRRGQQDPSISQVDRPDQSSLVRDLRVVVSRNLLDAQGVKLLILPKRRPTEIFWFPVPH